MATISPDFKTRLQQNPNSTFNIIARLRGDPSKHVADVEARGLTVKRTLTLIAALAIQGSASMLLALANEPWVLSIEEDKQVHTM